MAKGKSLCKLLKKIREQIAEANGIDYSPRECTFEGDCKGTCPACEREVGYLESQLSLKRNMGVPIKIIGLSVALASGAACTSDPSATCQSKEISSNSTDYDDDEVNIQGEMEIDSSDDQIYSEDSSSIYIEPMVGVIIDDDIVDNDDIVDKPDKEAQFPGGADFLNSFIQKNLHYPPEALDMAIEGTVIVQLIIEKNGTISDVKVVRSVDPLLDKEAVRVVTSMPNWIPAEKDGKPVRSIYRLPVGFSSPE